ncbi:MAG: ANTAR domain-containing protein [Jatrophihabitans sp.]
MESELLLKLAGLFNTVGSEFDPELPRDETLTMLSRRAVAIVPGAVDAAVSIGRNGVFRTVGATSELPMRVDAIQYELNSGPCVDAALQHTIYRTDDLATDTRWPEFGCRAVTETGVHSMMSFRMFLEDDTQRARMNFYASKPGAFVPLAAPLGLVIATLGAAIMSNVHHRDRAANLEKALTSSRNIGTAMGIIMATHHITQPQAFDVLRMASQNANRKIAAIAKEIINTGELDLRMLGHHLNEMTDPAGPATGSRREQVEASDPALSVDVMVSDRQPTSAV